MSLPCDYLQYDRLRYGMDHDRYQWSILPRREKVTWPNGARIALMVVPTLQWFPLDMAGSPFKPPGAMTMPYPDLRHYSLCNYGTRVGIFRIMDALDRRGMRASVAMNAAVARRYPPLAKSCIDRGWEVIANGLDMDHLHVGGMPPAEEEALVSETLALLREATGQDVRGWLSPARSESQSTPDIVASAGVDYILDWANDDMPYPLRTDRGGLHSMPLSNDMDDHTIYMLNRFSPEQFVENVCDQFDVMHSEAEHQGGRIMTLLLHPWISGQPFRIGALEQVLDYMMERQDVWAATASEILDAFKEGERQRTRALK